MNRAAGSTLAAAHVAPDSGRAAPAPGRPGLAGGCRIGMPQLTVNGLSERWLFAECGDRHWRLLAHAAGRAVTGLRDARERRVYPAFRALRLRQASLDGVREDDWLEIGSTLGRVSRTQFFSKHVVTVRGRLCAVVEMLSVFVARDESGVNRTASRSQVPGLLCEAASEEGMHFAQRARMPLDLRAGMPGTGARQTHGYAPLGLRPCPSLHFNGVGFLYFAAFHELCDQAEWGWFGPEPARMASSERHLLFHGNLDIGDAVAVQLADFERRPGQLHHHAQIVRKDDQKVIADVVTRRRDTLRESPDADAVCKLVVR